MLQDYIHECQQILKHNSTQSGIQKLLFECQNNLNPKDYSIEFFESLHHKTKEAMQIAIIGQFSSGKSTFLNALLGQDILPTGITPITSKVCKICYGDEYILEILYKDGTKVLENINYLHKLTRKNSENIDHFCLYAPILLLKEIHFLDTPGFNSQNQEDTNATLKILENVDGIIWLTLIDNAGKNSEKQLLKHFIKHYAQKSLCVLNQKDRLKTQEEVNISTKYAQEAFEGIFAKIIPISAIMALKAKLNTPQKLLESSLSTLNSNILSLNAENQEQLLSSFQEICQESFNKLKSSLENLNPQYHQNLLEQSNMPLIFEFLDHTIKPQASISKEYSILKKLKEFHILLHRQYHKIKTCYSLLNTILNSHLQDTTLQCQQDQEVGQVQFNRLYNDLDSFFETLAQFIYNSLDKQPHPFPKKQKSLLGEKTIFQAKEVTILPLEKLKTSLHNQDSEILKNCKALSAKTKSLCDFFEKSITQSFHKLESKTQQWQNTEVKKQELYCIAPNNQSLKDLQNFSQTFYENFLVEFEQNASTTFHFLQGELKFLSNFLTLSYPNAIDLILDKIDLKIKNAISKHAENPDFALFEPTFENIRDCVNEAFCFESFQTRLFGPMNLLKKSYSQFLTQLEKTINLKNEILTQKKADINREIEKILRNLQTIKQ